MGAWGEGLQANDTALDFIGGWEDKLRKLLRTRNPRTLRRLLGKAKGRWKTDDWAWGALGIAEWLLDRGLPKKIFKPSLAFLNKAIDAELDPNQIGCWKDQDARRQALELFRDRVTGKRVSQAAVHRTNEGLISRMTRKMAGITYEEAYGDTK